eukprot:TRINITY_DN9126_c0_g1_i1.p1 TRINITY_DN9126_c0_g1~~TRINITY_DN9126_c0_g1_i1.p1  ORF type:complete len:143 (-),score=19.20 TRINITY_DN9126_c0_g1_i1:140-568(-)
MSKKMVTFAMLSRDGAHNLETGIRELRKAWNLEGVTLNPARCMLEKALGIDRAMPQLKDPSVMLVSEEQLQTGNRENVVLEPTAPISTPVKKRPYAAAAYFNSPPASMLPKPAFQSLTPMAKDLPAPLIALSPEVQQAGTAA